MSVDTETNKLILYMHPGSYYSKIALLTLHEKRLHWKPHFVKVFNRENLHPWFVKLNPKGQLPVLQHEEKVISGSDTIITYLEETFSDDVIPKVLPASGTDTYEKVKSLVSVLRTFQNLIPTYGVLNFPELSSGCTMKEYEQKARLELLHHGGQYMDRLQEEYPEMTDYLRQKKNAFHERYKACMDIGSVRQGIISTEIILDQMESVLSSQIYDQKECWLCSNQFSEADITLAVLLHRLHELGLVTQLLDPCKRPLLNKYWKRLLDRPTFQAYLEDLEQHHKQLSSS